MRGRKRFADSGYDDPGRLHRLWSRSFHHLRRNGDNPPAQQPQPGPTSRKIHAEGGTFPHGFESDGLTLSDGAGLDVSEGGKATVETLTVGETGNTTNSVDEAGSTLTVVNTLTLGNGLLTLSSGGALIVDGDFDMGEERRLHPSAATVGNDVVGEQGSGTLTIRGEWRIGVAGTANPFILEGVTAEALGGISLGVQATGNGTLTVSQVVLSVTGDIVIGEVGTGAFIDQDGAITDAAAMATLTVGEEELRR